MIQQIDSKTRIKLKYSRYVFSTVFCLQRKKWYGWKTVSWTYPSVHKNSECGYIRTYLEWKETREIEKPKSEREIGKYLIARCGGPQQRNRERSL